jgi:hypothetical protein
LQQTALVNSNPYNIKNPLSISTQQQALVNYTTTQDNLSSSTMQQALTKSNTTNLVQKKLESIEASEWSTWESFPFKYHPEVLSESEENLDDDEFKEFMKKYKTEQLTSDSDETTYDDEEFEFLKKLRMKTRPKLRDKGTR